MSPERSVPFHVRLLEASTRSLSAGVPPSPPGTIYVLASSGGIAAPPRRDFALLFGRGHPDVHVSLGAGDPHVSRCQGRLICDGAEWWIRNEGRLPIRMPRSALLLSGQESPLPKGYSPLFIRSSPRREHLLEVRIVGAGSSTDLGSGAEDATVAPRTWELSAQERLVLTALGQRYLRQERYPQPQAWKAVADELNDLAGATEWNGHRAANIVLAVRERLSAAGVRGLTRDEVGEPVGNTLNHNLIHELLESTTLTPRDLDQLSDHDL
ncbi:MAG: hypothetical protein ACRDUA_02905 [Micromonosporaceae bacterium]